MGGPLDPVSVNSVCSFLHLSGNLVIVEIKKKVTEEAISTKKKVVFYLEFDFSL